MKNLFKLCIACCTLLFSGCTLIMWGHNSAIGENTTYQSFAKDTVRAFGKTQSKDKAQLVLMGDTYWYFIAPEDTEKLLQVLNTQLPKPFATLDNQPFEIKLSENAKSYHSSFELYYLPQNQEEKTKLLNLGFKPTEKNPKLYSNSYALTGEIYRKANNVIKHYQFETALPIDIKLGKTSRYVKDYSKLIENIGMTPVTLAGDVVLLGLGIVLSPLLLLD